MQLNIARMKNAEKGVIKASELLQIELKQVIFLPDTIEKIKVILKKKYNNTVMNTEYKIPLSLLSFVFNV
ncbi:hypothetical protein CWC21_21730 [Pseudoalteromonas phenolica]|nr:hypothetical protein CWC21_21730 [Pseudoalteromonas phenolica]